MPASGNVFLFNFFYKQTRAIVCVGVVVVGGEQACF